MDVLRVTIVDLETTGQKLHICCKRDSKCNTFWAAVTPLSPPSLVKPRVGLVVDFFDHVMPSVKKGANVFFLGKTPDLMLPPYFKGVQSFML